jgi:hypothetical protein
MFSKTTPLLCWSTQVGEGTRIFLRSDQTENRFKSSDSPIVYPIEETVHCVPFPNLRAEIRCNGRIDRGEINLTDPLDGAVGMKADGGRVKA